MSGYIYGIRNDNHKGLIKIGSTLDYEKRYFCYQTYAPIKWKYVFVYKILDDISCYKLDELIKQKYDLFRMKEILGGTEWYEESIYDDICLFLSEYGEVINNIDETTFTIISDIDSLRFQISEKENKIKKPYTYQQKCIDSVIDSFIIHDRTKLILACGIGKTLIAYWIMKKLNINNLVIFVPSLFLVTQFYNEWKKQMLDENLFNDNFVINASDFVNKRNMFFEDNMDLKNKIVISTYQSSYKLKGYEFDFAIFDEAHNTVRYDLETDKCFQYAIDDKNIFIKKRLFMTATEKIYNIDDEQIISMDNYDFYGNISYRINLKQALEYSRKILTDYKILTITKNTNEYNLEMKMEDNFGEKKKYYIYAKLIIEELINKKNIRKIITYHNRNKNSIRFHNILKELGNNDIDVFYVVGQHTNMTLKKRKRIIDNFIKSTKPSIICSSKVLNEGANLPPVDCVSFIDNRESAIDIVQCSQRPLRKYRGKDLAYIFIPLVLDKSINEIKEFRKLRMIIRNLGVQDYDIMNKFEVDFGKDGKKEKPLKEIIKQEWSNLKLIEYEKNSDFGEQDFIKCREYARKKKFSTINEGIIHFKKEDIPDDIPRDPERLYKYYGWIGWYDLFGLTKDPKYELMKIMRVLKKHFDFNDPNTFFFEKYREIDNNIKINNDLPIDIYKKYKTVFKKHTWYDLLELKIDWYEKIDECKKALHDNNKIDEYKINKQYYYEHCLDIDKKLPYDPFEFYRTQGFFKDDKYDIIQKYFCKERIFDNF